MPKLFFSQEGKSSVVDGRAMAVRICTWAVDSVGCVVLLWVCAREYICPCHNLSGNQSNHPSNSAYYLAHGSLKGSCTMRVSHVLYLRGGKKGPVSSRLVSVGLSVGRFGR